MNKQLKKIRTIIGIIILGLVTILALGYLYLRNSEWWIAVSLFSDKTRLENFQNFHNLFPSEQINHGESTGEFSFESKDLPEYFEFEGNQKNIKEFLEQTWTTGLIVAQGKRILFEEYYRDYNEESLVTSFSVAKSVISALIGIAIEEGYIGSVEDRVETYLSEFSGTAYGAVSIQDLLTMSSGIGFNENYDNFTSDITLLPIRVFGFGHRLPDLLKELPKIREPGTYNQYISSDTIVLGLILQEATGMSIGRFLEDKIWKPAGMEATAYWNTDTFGFTLSHAFLSARLRDFLRFGRIYINGGMAQGRQIIPEWWIKESIYRTEPRLQPGKNPLSDWTFGYGYQWWIPENPDGDYSAIGIWGQYIYIHPVYDVVIVKTSADYDFDVRDHETIAMFRTLAQWASEK
ncbi:serine hydrolase domain-containing protein [Aquiflexum lacus]|uniref:serine hydrolase domain-containing protein n=1 Tax=Aquiflexum lacus TaxID=2483805 RepID=UPI001892FD77|nr:serine hydrolase [Aquiflexum lacus]